MSLRCCLGFTGSAERGNTDLFIRFGFVYGKIIVHGLLAGTVAERLGLTLDSQQRESAEAGTGRTIAWMSEEQGVKYI